MQERLRVHVATLFILFASVTVATVQLVSMAPAGDPIPEPEPSFQASDSIINRETSSTRIAPLEDRAPFIAPTPIPIPPAAIALPPPTAPVGVASIGPIRGSGVLKWPVGGRITTYFQGGHQAVDIEAHCGTPVGAAIGGTVTYAGWKSNGGGYVVDISGGGFVTTYNHLSSVAVGYGASVTTGQLIAYSGMSGIATGCHLHFGVYLNGIPVNPLAYL